VVAAEHEVVDHGEVLEEPEVLERARDAERRDLRGPFLSRSAPSSVIEPRWGGRRR
jgi:hypothetical protein